MESISIDILQRRRIPLNKRMTTNLLFIQKAQKLLDRNMMNELTKLLKQYENPKYQDMFFEQLDDFRVEDSMYVDLMYLLIHSHVCARMMSNSARTIELYNKYISYLNKEELIKLLQQYEAEFEDYMRTRTTEYENYYVYMIYDLYMQAIENKDIYKTNVIIQMGFILIKFVGLLAWLDQGKELRIEDQAVIMSVYAKTYLHGKEAYEALYRILSGAKYNQLGYQIGLIRTTL